jgi:hypothetical protein
LSPLSPLGIVILRTTSVSVPLLVIETLDPASPVFMVPILIVAFFPGSPFSPVLPSSPSLPGDP